MKKFALLVLIWSLTILKLAAQDEPRLTAEQYISQFKEAAIADMKKTGVPASITMGAGSLRGSVLSTRGPGWTYLWCSGCRASGIAG